MIALDWITSLVTLTAMEIVLGIDNIVFISVVVEKLPEKQADRARQIGLALALVLRIVMLAAIFWLIGMTAPLFAVAGHAVSWRDVVLLAGGLFLLVKATREIHRNVEGGGAEGAGRRARASFAAVVAEIALLDMVFSADSIITAVGIADHLAVMIAAVTIAIGVMYAASDAVAGFIRRHPTTRMLALAFLLMIGLALVADGAGFHIPRGYIYTAMAFSAAVEALNVIARRNRGRRAAG